jgi:hypothetical protein
LVMMILADDDGIPAPGPRPCADDAKPPTCGAHVRRPPLPWAPCRRSSSRADTYVDRAFVVIGDPDLVIELHQPTSVRRLFGRRVTARRLDVGADDVGAPRRHVGDHDR